MGFGGPPGVLEIEPGLAICKISAQPAVLCFWPNKPISLVLEVALYISLGDSSRVSGKIYADIEASLLLLLQGPEMLFATHAVVVQIPAQGSGLNAEAPGRQALPITVLAVPGFAMLPGSLRCQRLLSRGLPILCPQPHS